MRSTCILLLLTAVALADRAADRAVYEGYLEFVRFIGKRGGSLQAMHDKIVPNFRKAGPRYKTSVLKNLPRAFQDKKYGLTLGDKAVIADTLAGCGSKGLAKCKQLLKANKRDAQVRLVIAEALGKCNNSRALKILTGSVIQDKDPAVAEAGVLACRSYVGGKQQARKNAMKSLITRYIRVTDAAAGKKSDTDAVKLYKRLQPALNTTLREFSGGTSLDSAKAWEAWLKEHATKPLPEVS
ncbi:MAG: HEAT repeat domain-containing protein [Planctomycetota bacterium]|nr:HEAT repeat domain-containing protein [Planctomycetota bacterium]